MTPTWQGKQNSWGGHLTLPREIYALPDGSLGTRLPRKLQQRLAELPWHELPDFPITFQPRPFGGVGTRDQPDIATEFKLQMPMATKAVRVGIAPLGEIVVEHAGLRILDAAGEVQGEIETDIPADPAVPICVFTEADMVEVFVNNRYSLVARLPAREGARRLTVHSDGTGASVSMARIGTLGRASP
jgi:hypothetical protein